MAENKLKLGIPKGSLQENTLKIFKSAGFDIDVPERGYFLKIDDPEIECFLLRPQEIPRYIEKGKLDLGISGDDWILESKAKIIEVCDLKYAKQEIKKVKWVLAVPENSKIKSVKDLEGKTISTEAVNLVKNYLKKSKVKARVEFSWGTTEVKPLERRELKEKAGHLKIMKKAAPGLLIKASAQIRTLEDVKMMVKAGADIIGTSSGVKIMKGNEKT